MRNRLYYLFVSAILFIGLALVQCSAKAATFDIGNGFAVTEDIVATAYHVVKARLNESSITVSINNKEFSGTIVAIDKEHDLALIRVFSVTALIPAVLTSPNVNEKAAAIVFNKTNTLTPSYGVIHGSEYPEYGFSFTGQICEGDSGGAIVNKDFKVIGMVIAIVDTGAECNNAAYGNSSSHIKALMLYNGLMLEAIVRPFTVVRVLVRIKY